MRDESKIIRSEKKITEKKFKLEDFEYVNDVGKGSFGLVKLMINKNDNSKYAVKCIAKDSIASKKQIEHI